MIDRDEWRKAFRNPWWWACFAAEVAAAAYLAHLWSAQP